MNPTIIIGAPRSGTNMLRDALAALPGFVTWPCDEINYIWRHGNLRYPSDEFPSELARPEVRRFVRKHFRRIGDDINVRSVVEKTCANSLRVGFVNEIVPEARYIYIRRNGLDAIASAVNRWQAPLNLAYVARKARFVPRADIPYYAIRYAGHRLHKLTSKEGRLASWGPRFDGVESLLRTCSLPQICAHVWRRCVDRAEQALANLRPERVCVVRYEEFVTDPRGELSKIVTFLGTEVGLDTIDAAVRDVTTANVGKGEPQLDGADAQSVRAIVRDR